MAKRKENGHNNHNEEFVSLILIGEENIKPSRKAAAEKYSYHKKQKSNKKLKSYKKEDM